MKKIVSLPLCAILICTFVWFVLQSNIFESEKDGRREMSTEKRTSINSGIEVDSKSTFGRESTFLEFMARNAPIAFVRDSSGYDELSDEVVDTALSQPSVAIENFKKGNARDAWLLYKLSTKSMRLFIDESAERLKQTRLVKIKDFEPFREEAIVRASAGGFVGAQRLLLHELEYGDIYEKYFKPRGLAREAAELVVRESLISNAEQGSISAALMVADIFKNGQTNLNPNPQKSLTYLYLAHFASGGEYGSKVAHVESKLAPQLIRNSKFEALTIVDKIVNGAASPFSRQEEIKL